MKLIYVADDDEKIRDLVKSHLEAYGYRVVVFENGQLLLDKYNQQPCDMVITDIVMPVLGGYDLCKAIRQKSMVPVFMISANNDEIDRVLGIELGSDDYIAKPISFRELLGKIKNTFRRIDLMNQNTQEDEDILQHQDLKLNKVNRQVFIQDQELEMTTKEFELLKLFLDNKNRAFSREDLIEKVWGYDYFGDIRQVDQVIKRLRKKMIEVDATCKIATVWGYGYKIGD